MVYGDVPLIEAATLRALTEAVTETQRRNELIERSAERQFKIDNPGREWSPVDSPSYDLDKRALYLFQAEQYLESHGVIPRARRHAASLRNQLART